MPFSDTDKQQIQNHGLSLDVIEQQLHFFQTGFPYAKIIEPATIGNGIIPLDTTAQRRYADIYEKYKHGHSVVKFVPASGAATRMFKDLFEFLNTNTPNATTDTVLNNLEQFAFYDALRSYLPEKPTDYDKISHIVNPVGLNYGNLPKGLILFHKYPDGPRTAIAEHLIEGMQYANCDGTVNIHFTVSPEHRAAFDRLLSQIVPTYQDTYGVKYNITMSAQKSATDTIAVNPDNTPFRTPNGSLLFRPAGHGALIENLHDIDADIIFIKNIDNICTDDKRAATIEYKRAMAGILIDKKERAYEYLRILDRGATDSEMRSIRNFITNELGLRTDVANADAHQLHDILNRPMRVCGMVRNTGEPGGGPFWVSGADGTQSLQIIEPGQISPDARDILRRGTFFNPADLVCATRDYQNNKFDLSTYIDTRTGFISEKSSNGVRLRAMERPGLWNGAMANWITLFVETPGTTFSPVKVVSDLLSPAHQ